MNRRVDIDRLELDLRGVDPQLAEAAVRLFGPALQAELARGIERRGIGQHGSAARIDAGRIAPASQADALAARLAQRVAGALNPSEG
ncbi:MAG TPA: hypothetical protein PLB41_00175 [Rubrivivax sp.]|nr:hypothetical protein [Rubrivivax sp.]HPO18224.1 hypothetical protein [Rubrivivax sp.]